jgi:hypothetical protein
LIEVWINETGRCTWFLFELGWARPESWHRSWLPRAQAMSSCCTARNTEHNNAVVLRDYVKEKIERNANAPSSHSGRDRDG